MANQLVSILCLSGSIFALLSASGCGETQDSAGHHAPTAADATAAVRRPRSVASQRLVDADLEPRNWLTYGRTYKEQRHSPLTGMPT
jgi:quinohemoprotein ethanol dehydrogenase